MIRRFLLVMLLLSLSTPAFAQSSNSEEPVHQTETIVVTATRLEQAIDELAANVTVIETANLKTSAPRQLDELLRQVPGFSLLRQSSSVVSSNTIQGVSLRGVGPTAAGRTLVLLDGVPLNDPFGGTVAWSRIPVGSIDKIEVVRGGGSGIWGSLAMGGVIQILTSNPNGRTLRLNGRGGSRGTGDIEAFVSEARGPLTFSGGGSYFDTDGYHVWREDQLGEVDIPVTVQHETLHGRIDYRRSDNARFYLQGDYADEDRKKGTPLSRMGLTTRFAGAGGSITTSGGDEWAFNLFATSRSANNLSTTVARDRSSEKPRSNVHDSPSLSLGTNVQWSRRFGVTHHLAAGADHQWIDGESHELGGYSTDDAAFTTEKHILGKQQLAGIYLQDVIRPSVRWRIVAGARIDVIGNFDATERLVDLATGTATSETVYTDETRTTLNPSLGIVYYATNKISLRGSAYRAFRAPTISELYRGFTARGGVVNAGNSGLDPEQLVGAELGADLWYSRALTARLTGFWNEVENTITQRTIAHADENEDTEIEPCGNVPAGGVCRQRDNVGRLRSRGFEFETTYRQHDDWRLSGSYIYDDATLTESDDPSLVGNWVRQVPRHHFVLRASFDRASLLSASIQARVVGKRYEDDKNDQPVDQYRVVDLFLARQIIPGLEAVVSVENLFDTENEVRQTSRGLIEVGAPRTVQGGIRLNF